MDLENLKYPIGHFRPPEIYNAAYREEWKSVLKEFPSQLSSVVLPLNTEQLNTPYRPEGWTVRQLVHHLADSHVNSYIRFKLAVTEDNPLVKTYDQAAWCELADAVEEKVNYSLNIIEGIHARWISFLETFRETDYKKTLSHPEFKHPLSLDFMLALYAWHCHHHLAHIVNLIDRKGW